MTIVSNMTNEYISINVPLDEVEWSPTSTYTYELSIVRYGNYLYQYAGETGTNSTDNPQIDSQLSIKKWVQIAPTNQYAMLDKLTNTQTVYDDFIEFSINWDNYNTLAVLS